MIEPHFHIRIARPVLDLAASREFYVEGLGLTELETVRGRPELGERDLLMTGPPQGQWHLELTYSAVDVVVPAPTPEDLLVVYVESAVTEEAVARATRHGGTVVASHNPYWDRCGVTIADPDGYRVVLASQTWR
jgi:catechol 2,3-dioxygenase-like lactoylglutathione lyase family enzyme